MKAKRLTVRPVNKIHGHLPDNTKDRDLIVFKTKNGRVIEAKPFHVFNEMRPSVHGYSHYVIVPFYLP